MSAKHSKKGANKPTPITAPVASAPTAEPALAGAGASVGTLNAEAGPSWLDSSDPKKRRWGKIVFIAVWIYVGALWLLALDQTFSWGIFGPKVPPLP